MQTFKGFKEVLYKLNDQSFDSIALQLFHFQAENNPIYKQYLHFLNVDWRGIDSINKIPFLPISFFKNQIIKTGNWKPELVFTSSGTTGQQVSSHSLHSLSFYQQHSERIFERFFGPLKKYHILALLPSYLERSGSSLIYMVDHFIKKSESAYSGFFLHDLNALIRKLEALRKNDRKTLLIGVSFALLDLAEKANIDLSHCLIMETGGMKGRRQEIIREELHAVLMQSFNVKTIYSEYGMTELLSQAYSFGNGLFKTPPSMKILLKELNDPFSDVKEGQTGKINVIDLANSYSCAFIETQDLGRMHQSGYFEVLGRMDNSDSRGCNLLIG